MIKPIYLTRYERFWRLTGPDLARDFRSEMPFFTIVAEVERYLEGHGAVRDWKWQRVPGIGPESWFADVTFAPPIVRKKP